MKITSKKGLARWLGTAGALALCVSLFGASPARAEGYIGGLIGYGLPMGLTVDYDGGLVYGGTVGYQLMPTMGIAFTYNHSELGGPIGLLDMEVDKYLGEVNFFSVAGLAGGVHVGSVTEDILGASTSNLGVGAHLGMDFKIAPEFSIGASAYWTYVDASDTHSLLDLMVPVKFWF